MTVDQIYELVNNVAKQTLGATAITAVDTATLVALGDTVLSSTNSTENFLNTLVARIGRTIIAHRKYDNQLAPIVMEDMEWGAVVQKIRVLMPTVAEDNSFELEDGKSIDMYNISKPKTEQKLFYKKTAYQCHVTIQEFQLKEAFLSASAMGSFISAVFGEVKNYLEYAIENLSRLTMANYMALTGNSQRINLVTMFNAAKGANIDATTALTNPDFLRYAIGQMNLYAKKMKTMSNLYNTEGKTRFTPDNKQMFAIINEFQTAMETEVQYAAFHDDYVKKRANIELPYWQAAQNPLDISLKVYDGNTTTKKDVKLENVVGFLFDREALGTYRKEEAILTTPMNARGRYTNTFWHEQQMWFNDLSENGIIFTLN